mmetsp:Transcript_37723/g.90587  ORF Transcript_37723/g.90587 Transcript_37723/m.90587 type:complete len:149 (-) Transcript_37723:637-1083(-)
MVKQLVAENEPGRRNEGETHPLVWPVLAHVAIREDQGGVQDSLKTAWTTAKAADLLGSPDVAMKHATATHWKAPAGHQPRRGRCERPQCSGEGHQTPQTVRLAAPLSTAGDTSLEHWAAGKAQGAPTCLSWETWCVGCLLEPFEREMD